MSHDLERAVEIDRMIFDWTRLKFNDPPQYFLTTQMYVGMLVCNPERYERVSIPKGTYETGVVLKGQDGRRALVQLRLTTDDARAHPWYEANVIFVDGQAPMQHLAIWTHAWAPIMPSASYAANELALGRDTYEKYVAMIEAGELQGEKVIDRGDGMTRQQVDSRCLQLAHLAAEHTVDPATRNYTSYYVDADGQVRA